MSRTSRSRISWILVPLFGLVGMACGGSVPPSEPTSAPTVTVGVLATASEPTAVPLETSSAVKSPLAIPAAESYPEPSQSEGSYPVPATTPLPEGPAFHIDVPLYAGDTEVTGTGPPGVPIRLVDVNAVGEELATTTIGRDGTFRFRVDAGLPAGHSIGLQIGQLEGTGLDYRDFERSKTYYDRPLIGTLLDMASVVER